MNESDLNGHLTYGEALKLCLDTPLPELCGLANSLREKYQGNFVDTCSIMNARSGKCSEDCKWCAQSFRNPTGCEVYGLCSPELALEHARRSEAAGIGRFSLVTSGRTLSDSDVERVAKCFELIAKNVKISLCGSLGLLNAKQLKRLADAGMTRFHCNLETAPSKFRELCTTHTIDDKIATLRAARGVGLTVCSGGIIGMGETAAQRVELAYVLRTIGVDSIPVNILQPIRNTPLESMPPLPDDDILRAFAFFKILNPKAHIRFAGGRTRIGKLQETAMKSGVSSLIMGDMLTTEGAAISADFAMLDRLGYEY